MTNYEDGSSFGVLLETGTTSDTVYIQADSLGLTVPVSSQVFTSPFAEFPIAVFSKRHSHTGTISGVLLDADIYGTVTDTIITAKEWAERLFMLIAHQADNTISLTSKPYQTTSVALTADYTIEPQTGGSLMYQVSLPWVEIGPPASGS